MNNTTKTIDCTPTWSGILPVILALIQNPNTKKDGLHELQRMAELADAYMAENKKTDMKLLKKLYYRLNPLPKPKYGAKIFEQKSWLTRQTEDAIYRQSKAQIYQTR